MVSPRVSLKVPRGPRGCLGRTLSDPRDAIGVPWGSLGVPWSALGPPGKLLDHFWTPKNVQKLKSACLKSIEKPFVFIAYLRLGVSKSEQGSLKKRDLQQELEFVCLGGHFDGAWSICACAVEVPRRPLGRPWTPWRASRSLLESKTCPKIEKCMFEKY